MGAAPLRVGTEGTARPLAETPFKGAFKRGIGRSLQGPLSLGQLRWGGQETGEGARWSQALGEQGERASFEGTLTGQGIEEVTLIRQQAL